MTTNTVRMLAAALFCVAASARAEAPAADPPPPPPDADAPLAAPPVGTPVDRLACEQAIRNDPAWQSAIRSEMDAEKQQLLEQNRLSNIELDKRKANLEAKINGFHVQEASKVTSNNKHVFAAYAAMWVVAVAFLAAMLIRQRKLSGQIATLEAELERELARGKGA